VAIQPQAALESISKSLREAENNFLTGCYLNPESEEREDYAKAARYYLERAFTELLVLAESLSISLTYWQIRSTFNKAMVGDLLSSEMGPDEPYLTWAAKGRQFVDAIASVHGFGKTVFTEISDLKEILRRAVYVICDKTLFGTAPAKEADVHDRIEGILKCHFADLKRKPTLSKPIKNFEPDTGIPSIRTLIEYKFVTTRAEAKRVVDEILADTSGYRSPHWTHVLFVIYETTRVQPEAEWMSLLESCGLAEGYDIVVLSGDSAK